MTQPGQSLYLRAAQVIDGTGTSIADGAVSVVDDRIAAVGPADAVERPQGAQVIEFPKGTLIPGLMDIHIHPSLLNGFSFTNYRASHFEITPQLQAFYALFHAQICLEMGFTTLRDTGSMSYAGTNVSEMVAVRDAIEAGIVIGPRLVTSVFTSITGGHFDLVMPRAMPRAPGVTADGPWELRKLVRTYIRAGCDVIKTCVSGGGGTDFEEPSIRNMTQEELDAVVDEAHAFHKTCACHCFTPEAQKMALQAGADTLEHCVWTDDEAIALMLEKDAILVPTLAHRSDEAIDLRRKMGTPEFVLQKLKTIQPQAKETFQRLHAAGVKMAMGSDTGYDPEIGRSAYELQIYVEYGMTPMEAILTATRNAAEALKLDDVIGSLEPGKFADIVAIDGDPLEDITVLQDRRLIAMVVKAGRIVVDRRAGKDVAVVLDQRWADKADSVLRPRAAVPQS